MYLVPGYITHSEENGNIIINSNLQLNAVKLTEDGIKKEFRELIRSGGCSELDSPLKILLHEQEKLNTPNEIRESLKNLQELMDEVLFVTIMPTEGCNFRCPYCYESHIPNTMFRETLDQIMSYISHQASNFKYIQLNWFGGEPTLCKDVVLEVSDFLRRLGAEKGFKFASNMTSNGYLLDRNSFVEYYDKGITDYQITLDGWNHDKTRPHVSGRGTLETILFNLKAISQLPKEKYQFHIVIRHNILPDDRDYSWYDYLLKLFGNDERFFILIRPVGNWGGESVQKMNILEGSERNSLVLEHIEYVRKIGMNCENGAGGIFGKICPASYPNSLVFRANGRIEKCTVCLNRPENHLGDVIPDIGVVIDEKINQLWSTSDLKEKCLVCPDVLSCLNMQCRKPQIVGGSDECGRCSRESTRIY